MKKLKRWWKKLCVGLAASAKERDITHGKRDKFGGTGMKAAVVVALPLLMAIAPEAKAGGREDGPRTPGDGLVAGARAGAAAAGRYATYDNLVRFLGAMNTNGDPMKQQLYILNETTKDLQRLDTYRQGYNAGVTAGMGATVGSYSTVAAGPIGGFHYMTICQY